MGVQWRALDVPGIERLQGAGVYYGGGASRQSLARAKQLHRGRSKFGRASGDALLEIRAKGTMLVRGGSLASTMSHYLIEQIDKTANIDVWTHTSVIEVHGETRLRRLRFSVL